MRSSPHPAMPRTVPRTTPSATADGATDRTTDETRSAPRVMWRCTDYVARWMPVGFNIRGTFPEGSASDLCRRRHTAGEIRHGNAGTERNDACLLMRLLGGRLARYPRTDAMNRDPGRGRAGLGADDSLD